jgi:hypothetical protein
VHRKRRAIIMKAASRSICSRVVAGLVLDNRIPVQQEPAEPLGMSKEVPLRRR